MHEPDGYPRANDRVIVEAEESDGVLVPFCRLDPRLGGRRRRPRRSAASTRARAASSCTRGREQFRLEETATEPIFAVAHERGVPVLVHAGRGIPALGRDALDLAGRSPGADHPGARGRLRPRLDLAPRRRRIRTCSSTPPGGTPADMLSLFALVPPGQILWGSDAPYGTPLQSQVNAFRCALHAGVPPEAIARKPAGRWRGSWRARSRWTWGRRRADPRSRPDLLLARVGSYLQTAAGRMMLRDGP